MKPSLGQVAFEAYKDAFDKERGAWFTSMSYKWETLPDFLRLGWEAAAKAVASAVTHIDPNIRAVVEQAIQDYKADPSLWPEVYRNDLWTGYLESVEIAIDDSGDIHRRVYIKHTYYYHEFKEWLSKRLAAEVENGGNIQIVMEW